MRFMMILKADAGYEAGRPPDPALIAEFMQLHVDVLGQSYEGMLEVRPTFDPAGAVAPDAR